MPRSLGRSGRTFGSTGGLIAPGHAGGRRLFGRQGQSTARGQCVCHEKDDRRTLATALPAELGLRRRRHEGDPVDRERERAQSGRGEQVPKRVGAGTRTAGFLDT